MRLNFTRHLILAGLLFVGAVGFMAYWNWDTVSTMVENASALNEGGREASRIRSPDDFLAYLARHRDDVSLVAVDASGESPSVEGASATHASGGDSVHVAHHADVRRPLVALPRLQLVAEYARRVEAGQADSSRRVALRALAPFSLPGVTEQAHTRAVDALRSGGRLQVDAAGDTTAALADVVRGIAAYNDEAAADWLMLQWGRDAVAALPETLGLPDSDPPRPTTGTYLTWVTDTDAASNASASNASAGPTRADAAPRDESPADEPRIDDARIEAIRAMPREVQIGSAFALAERLRADTTFRRVQAEALAARGSRLSLTQQRALARASYPKGTAADYARLLARVATGTLVSAPVAAYVRSDLERSVTLDSIRAPVTAVATKSGAYPGLMSFTGYARRPDDQPTRAVTLLLDDVPLAVVYHLVQTGIDKGFQLQLLADDAYAARVRDSLRTAANADAQRPNGVDP